MPPTIWQLIIQKGTACITHLSAWRERKRDRKREIGWLREREGGLERDRL